MSYMKNAIKEEEVVNAYKIHHTDTCEDRILERIYDLDYQEEKFKYDLEKSRTIRDTKRFLADCIMNMN